MQALLARLSMPAQAAPLRLAPVELSALVREATAPLAGDERVRLRVDVRPVPLLCADAEALLLVLQNLITNAVEALDGAGTIAVSAKAQGRWAVVSVRDTGCGIPEAFLRGSLFVPFRSTKKGGWGIGLYQSRDIVERHGGTIAVESVEGQGTTFEIRLPLTTAGRGEP
jgi:hypothetical protein